VRFIDPLCSVLANDPIVLVRVAAAEALGVIGDKRIVRRCRTPW